MMIPDGVIDGLDTSVHDRIIKEAEAFQKALDEAINEPSDDTWEKLRDAADGLMRSLAAAMMPASSITAP